MAGITTSNRMNMQHFHDFYFLQAMKAAVTTELSANSELEFSKPVEKFIDDLDRTIDVIVPNMALRTFMYLYAACLGEARHTRESVAKERFIYTDEKRKNGSRSNWFRDVILYRPTSKNLNVLIDVFAQDWRSGYGGTAWGNIAQALVEYETTDPTAWIDHVVDLEHNNGTAFSKPEGYDTIMFDVSYPDRFSAFLDYKFQDDILTQKPEYTSYRLCISPRIHALLTRFTKIFNRKEVTWVKPDLENLSDYAVEWGDCELRVSKKWGAWISIGESNKPNAKYMLQSHGLYDMSPSYYTEDKFREAVENVIRRAKDGLMSEFATPAFKAKITKEAMIFYNKNKSSCKKPMAPVVYPKLPCSVTNDSDGQMVFTFDLPYQDGYGDKTDDGFKVTIPNFASVKGVGYIVKKYGDLMLWIGSNHYWIANPTLEALLD